METTASNEQLMEYSINNINEQNIEKFIERLKNLTQRNEYKIRANWACQCLNEWYSEYTTKMFKKHLREYQNHFSKKCSNCHKECQISYVFLEKESLAPQEQKTEYFISFMNDDNVSQLKRYKVYSRHLNDLILNNKDKYKAHFTWSCEYCGFSENYPKFSEEPNFLRFRNDSDKYLWHPFYFWRICRCYKKCQISSIRLYKQLTEDDSQITDIIRHLIGNKKYLVYGYWSCRSWNCRHTKHCGHRITCNATWTSFHKWLCEHQPHCNSLNRCRTIECSCIVKRPSYGHSVRCQRNWTSKNIWKCGHDPECETEKKCKRKELECSYECLDGEYSQELLKSQLHQEREELMKFYTKRCCNANHLISSFRLYLRQPEHSVDESPVIEIICHLVWNKYYKVFGHWRCNKCHKYWISSYTWIKLQKFIEKVPGKKLKQGEFYMQGCNRCNNMTNRILKYEHLKESDDDGFHKRHLCKNAYMVTLVTKLVHTTAKYLSPCSIYYILGNGDRC